MLARIASLLILSGVVAACSLTRAADLDKAEDGVCPTGQKACVKVGTANEKACVLLTDPATGCAVAGNCSPCAFEHGAARCGQNGTCELGGCEAGYVNCKRDGRGCETDTAHDPQNCGECGNVCPSKNGTPGCPDATCTLKCFEGFADCNNPSPGVPDADGCETKVDTDQHCGDCTTVCSGGTRCDATARPPKCI